VTLPIHITVTGVAGNTTLTISQHTGSGGAHVPLYSILLDPNHVRDLANQLLATIPETPPPAPVRVRRNTGHGFGMWVFTCPNHDGREVRGSFFEHADALAAAIRHAHVNHQEQQA
jgi:hypothetical protein